ncbi:hypothetical protein DSM110093_03737 (plasmid) [Sulfitobacter sp. DSM 110093]|uniref:hypothetical protein n=1 Tax=Sulfitobacter sp. DSM 110093 TaxID=2883127 RepID=UPI001FAC48BF|nr:hypothetical protein [Sulfitobacter sp. DSM 110093]UOA33902.1 hypothetical protein DSM110093_03737 [Sulfitobacter sp. DSM 110093]
MRNAITLAGGLAAIYLFTNGAQALELTDGSYKTAQDGGTGILEIANGQASLGVKGSACVGDVAGQLVALPDGALSFSQNAKGRDCTLVLRETDYGLAKIMPAKECSVLHGDTCSFFGIVKTKASP